MSASRSASVLVVTIGVVSVVLALAFGLVVSARIHVSAARASALPVLARGAAEIGLSHAIGDLARDFAGREEVASNVRSAYRTRFWPIDLYAAGSDTPAVPSDDHPYGREYTPEDVNDNDSPADNLLTELYCGQSGGRANYADRAATFRDGQLLHPGAGRWIEPWQYHDDMEHRPISFHLAHPFAAVAGDPDPARRAGEPWLPDVDRPWRLDAGLRAAATPEEVRYRLRYALAIEDLGGHLLAGLQGPYRPGASAAAGGTPGIADDLGTIEVDPLAQRYAGSFANLAACFYPVPASWGWLRFTGSGYRPDQREPTAPREAAPVLAGFDATTGLPLLWSDAPAGGTEDGRLDVRLPAWTSTAWATSRGCAYSPNQLHHENIGDDSQRASAHTFTPFGRASAASAAPVRWFDGYSDCPWRINLPTATPLALRAMVFAYLPAEARQIIFTSRDRWVCTALSASGAPVWTKDTTVPTSISYAVPGVNLFDATPGAPLASLFTHLAGQPYPGSDPASPGPDWRVDLGAEIDLNELSIVGATANPPRAPLQGQVASLYPAYDREMTLAYQPWVGGEWVKARVVNSPAFLTLTGGDGYRYADSYWLDLASAMCHALAVAQFAWCGQTGAGLSRFPASSGDPDLAAVLGTPTLDADADGDGVADTPSRFAQVEQIDGWFLKALGEHPRPYPGRTRPDVPAWGLYIATRDSTWSYKTSHAVANRPSACLKSLLRDNRISAAESRMMELAVNDMRMSFFGASGQYPGFRPLDLDDDGRAESSAYTDGAALVDASGAAPEPERRFSLTGTFVFQKARYLRIFVRGEVFDQLVGQAVAAEDREAVVAIDPDGRFRDLGNARISGASALDVRLLYQRRIDNAYWASRARVDR